MNIMKALPINQTTKSNNKTLRLFYIVSLALILFSGFGSGLKAQSGTITQFVYTSDLHYGVVRTFQGKEKVEATTVNKAMIQQRNTLPTVTFPNDGGVNANKKVGSINYMIITGDIANRQQGGIQSATASWAQFSADYLGDGVTLKTSNNQKISFLLACGNHDVSNAIGYPKPMNPLTDASAMVGIYNRMLTPSTPRTNETYNYNTDKINYTKEIAGVHFMFVTMWPDSTNRRSEEHTSELQSRQYLV